VEETQKPFRTIAILGLGLIGGSLAKAARAKKACDAIVGWSHHDESRELALQSKIVDATVDSIEQAIADADLVILCTPVNQIAKALTKLGSLIKPGTIVTDVGSTKRTIVKAGEKNIVSPSAFVGSHPMTGSERSGLAASKAELFQDALCLLTPTEQTDKSALARVEEFWQALGCRTSKLGPADHDRLMSDISHLPHALAAALIAMQDDRALAIAGPSFRDLTRIAASDPALWREIFLDNTDSAIRSIDRCVAWLRDFRTALQANDGGKLETMLTASSKRRQSMTRTS